MSYVFEPAERLFVPVVGTDARFPVRRIYCVGRNYADHAREMGHDPDAEPPFFFDKPADVLTLADENLPYPPMTADLHYEGELVVGLACGGVDLTPDQSAAAIFGYAVGNDFTRRDLQADAKELRRPWDLSKGFEGAAVIGPMTPIEHCAHIDAAAIRSLVNGEVRQAADLSHMIWPVASLIATLSQYVTLAAGDLIFTGTPAGVGSVKKGDVVRVEIDGLEPIETKIV